MIEALFPKTRLKVLTLLCGHPHEGFHLHEVFRKTGTRQGVVQRELDSLVRAGIALRTRDGNRTIYSINTESPFYPEMRGLIVKSTGLLDVLREALRPRASEIRVAAVYGSFARGEEGPRSDIDLLVVGSVRFSDVVGELESARERLGREINMTVFPELEFRRKAKIGDHFVSSLLKDKLLLVLGAADDLSRLAR